VQRLSNKECQLVGVLAWSWYSNGALKERQNKNTNSPDDVKMADTRFHDDCKNSFDTVFFKIFCMSAKFSIVHHIQNDFGLRLYATTNLLQLAQNLKIFFRHLHCTFSGLLICLTTKQFYALFVSTTNFCTI